MAQCSGISKGFWNSVKITVPATLISVLWGAFVRYILSFWRPEGANLLFGIIVLAGSIPLQVFVYPVERIVAFFDIYGTRCAIILVHIVFSLPLTVLLFRNDYASIPYDLFQAARIDGAGFVRIFRALMLPMPSLPDRCPKLCRACPTGSGLRFIAACQASSADDGRWTTL